MLLSPIPPLHPGSPGSIVPGRTALTHPGSIKILLPSSVSVAFTYPTLTPFNRDQFLSPLRPLINTISSKSDNLPTFWSSLISISLTNPIRERVDIWHRPQAFLEGIYANCTRQNQVILFPHYNQVYILYCIFALSESCLVQISRQCIHTYMQITQATSLLLGGISLVITTSLSPTALWVGH